MNNFQKFSEIYFDLLLFHADNAKEKLGLFIRDCFSLLVKKITKYEPCGA